MPRIRLLSLIFAVAVLVSLSSVVVVRAQEKGEIKRNILMKQQLASVPGHDIIQAQVELSPGAAEAKHTHPGELVGYVQQGTLTLNIEGKPPQTVSQGQSFLVPANAVHWGVNDGKEPVKVVATMVLESGKPGTVPAK